MECIDPIDVPNRYLFSHHLAILNVLIFVSFDRFGWLNGFVLDIFRPIFSSDDC